MFFRKLKTGNQLTFQQYSALAHCSHTVFKLLRREKTNAFIAPKLWLLNIPDFNDVEYGLQNLGSAMRVRLSTACSRCR